MSWEMDPLTEEMKLKPNEELIEQLRGWIRKYGADVRDHNWPPNKLPMRLEAAIARVHNRMRYVDALIEVKKKVPL